LGLLVQNLQICYKKTFETHCLFQNPLHGFAWVVKLQTKFELKLGSLDYKINGFFRITKGYQLLVNLSPISLVLLAFKFHKNLGLEKKVV
jgi:hypothetical protein